MPSAQDDSPGPTSVRNYDPSTHASAHGEIQEVLRRPRQGPGGGYGVHVTIKGADTGDETTEVHLGPQWYLEEIGLVLNVGDHLEVDGSSVAAGQLIAQQLRRGDKNWVLRDENGRPKWAGRGGGRGPRRVPE